MHPVLTKLIQRKYLVHERPETIYAAYDQKVSHHGVAGDVDSGKAWRTVRRPSDMVCHLLHLGFAIVKY